MENVVNLQRLQKYYRDKRVFITGHTGFKGAWTMACLHLAGARVKGYSRAPEYANGLFDVLQPLRLAESCIADIRDKDRLQKELLAFQPDLVFHLAAQPLVRRSYEIPAETFDINVTGTANLLEAVVRLEKKCTTIVITTDKVYENKEQDILYREKDKLGGYDPYSASKACAELVISSFRNSFFNPDRVNVHGKTVVSARAGNVIGGGDWSRDRIIPDIVRALQNGQAIEVRNPFSIRPWQHVLEPVTGYLLLGGLLSCQPGSYAGAYNFGPLPEDHLQVKELVEEAIGSWGSGSWLDRSSSVAVHEAGLLKLDISLAKKDLGWIPRLTARQAVQWSLDWYKLSPEQQAEYTFSQIKSYLAL